MENRYTSEEEIKSGINTFAHKDEVRFQITNVVTRQWIQKCSSYTADNEIEAQPRAIKRLGAMSKSGFN